MQYRDYDFFSGYTKTNWKLVSLMSWNRGHPIPSSMKHWKMQALFTKAWIMLAVDQRTTFREIAEVNINRAVNISSTNIRNITGPLCPPLMMCQAPFHPVNIPGQIKFCNISPSTFLNLVCFFALVFSCTWLCSKSWFFSEIACVAIKLFICCFVCLFVCFVSLCFPSARLYLVYTKSIFIFTLTRVLSSF